MMSPLTVALLLAALWSVVVCQDDKLYITADNKLIEVCAKVAGTSSPIKLMEQYDKVGRLDRMPLPAGWNDNGQGCITVKAHNSNTRTWGGILACVKSTVLVNLFWQCVDMPALEGASCCNSCDNPIWDLPSSSNILQMKPNEHRKKDYMKKLPPQCVAVKGQTNWIWSKNRLQPDVCCRSAPCAPLCDSCDTAGPEKCDDGKCRFGATGQVAPVCKSKCFVKVEIFTGAGTDYFPKAQITNAATDEVYHLPIITCQAAFMIDIATCRPINDGTKEFFYQANDDPGTTGAVNDWVSAQYGAWAGSFIVDLASGGASLDPPISLKWLAVQRSDGAGVPVITEIYSGGNRTASFTITGYTLDMNSQEWSDVVTAPFP